MSTSQLPQSRREQQRSEWAARAVQLDQSYEAAQIARASTKWVAAKEPSSEAAAAHAQAGRAELAAAKAYNDFLETGSTAYKLSQDIAGRLKSGGDLMSALERHALQIEQRNLEQVSIEFQNFKSEAQLAPIFAAPVYADNKIYSVDGSVRWDPSTVTGQLGSAWDSVKRTLPELAHAPFTPEQQAKACENVLDVFAGALIGKALPAPGSWSFREREVWNQLAGRGYPSNDSPSARTCRLIYPPGGAPEHLQKYGIGQPQANPGDDVWTRVDRMLEAGKAGDWATFRTHTQALAAMPAAQEMTAQAKSTVDQQEQQAALQAQVAQQTAAQAQQQNHPVMRMTH